jgi:hypothetical protein
VGNYVEQKSMASVPRIFSRILAAAVATLALTSSGCKDHSKDHSAHNSHSREGMEARPASTLAPAEGAKVKILTPAKDQVFTSDEIPLHFELIKGKRGEHVHAYVDGQMAGMFKTTKGTLTGIKRGNHTLELRVVTADHNNELDAVDKVQFIVK